MAGVLKVTVIDGFGNANGSVGNLRDNYAVRDRKARCPVIEEGRG